MDLTKEDLTKVHNEINLYVKERATLLVSAITVVGAVLAWGTQRIQPDDIRTLQVLYLAGTALLLFIALLVVLDFAFHNSIVKCATYLLLNGASKWERDYIRYRHERDTKERRYLTSRKLIYVALGALSAIWPAVIAWIVFDATIPSTASLLHSTAALSFFILGPLYMHRRKRIRRAEIRRYWRRALRLGLPRQPPDEV